MDALDPFLANFNPIVRYLDYYKAPSPPTSSPTRRPAPPARCRRSPASRSRATSRASSSIFNSETLSIYRSAWPPTAATATCCRSRSATRSRQSQGEVFPSHDCDNTGATGGLGSGQVTPGQAGVPASNPPAQEGGYYPLSNQLQPTTPSMPAPALPPPLNIIPGGTSIDGSMAAFAPCTLQSDFPSIFGGGRVPIVTRDP